MRNSYAEGAEGKRAISSPYDRPFHRVRRLVSASGSPYPSSPAEQIRRFILRDDYLRAFYTQIYNGVLSRLSDQRSGEDLELGSGVGLAREFLPRLTTSDIELSDSVDRRIDALEIPYANQSVRNLVLVNSFHHLSDPLKFLREAERTLMPGGRVIIFDPFWGPLAALVYSVLHPEPFLPFAPFKASETKHPWESNQALAWICFRRSKAAVASSVPNLRQMHVTPVLALSYLLSGGVYGRTRFSPKGLKNLLAWESRRQFPAASLFCFITLEKI